jgi:hypothetical protein
VQLGRRRRRTISSPLNAGQKARALTASGMRVTRGSADTIRRLSQPWQLRAYAYYDMLGEIKYAAQFYSRGLAPLRLYAAYLNDDGEWEPVEDKNHPAVENLDRIQDPGGGRAGLLGAYGRLMFLAGECYLFVSTDPETEIEQWEMLSTDELRMQGETYYRVKAPQLPVEEYRPPTDDEFEPTANGAVAFRLWRRHPRFSMLADSTMQGVLDLCEELVILTQAVRSRARSRLAGAGILVVDNAVTPAPLETGADEDPNEDPFVRDLVAAMMAPIADEGAASAVVPLVLHVNVPEGRTARDLIEHVQIVDPTQLYPETGLRTECIDRIAIGLDMPPEELKGLSDANHWSAWQIDEQSWTAHLKPIAEQLCDDLTASFYRPTLKREGVADWQRYAIRYDAADIINHPDRSKDAKDLHDRGAIGDAALREASGFDDQDEPTEDERNRWLGVRLRDSSVALYGVPALRPGSELETSEGELVVPPAPETTGEQPADANKQPPTPPDQTAAVRSIAGANGHGSARIIGAADVGVLRAREVAGNRLVSLAKRNPEYRDLVRGVTTGQVAHTLGAIRTRELGESPKSLVSGARPLIVDGIRMQGVPAEIAGRLADAIEEHAARTLYEKQPTTMPPAFANYVAGLTAR